MLGQMPDPEVSDNIRKRSRAKSSRKGSEKPKATNSSLSKKKEGPSSAPSLKKKFEEHGKRVVIDEFLKTAKKPSVALDVPLKLQTARERKLTVVNTMRDAPQKLRLVMDQKFQALRFYRFSTKPGPLCQAGPG